MSHLPTAGCGQIPIFETHGREKAAVILPPLLDYADSLGGHGQKSAVKAATPPTHLITTFYPALFQTRRPQKSSSYLTATALDVGVRALRCCVRLEKAPTASPRRRIVRMLSTLSLHCFHTSVVLRWVAFQSRCAGLVDMRLVRQNIGVLARSSPKRPGRTSVDWTTKPHHFQEFPFMPKVSGFLSQS